MKSSSHSKSTTSTTTDTHTHHSSRAQSSTGSQKGVFFLISRKVTVAYGPYLVQGVMDYRTERLEGLVRALRKAGGEVILKPTFHVNEVRVWHLEHKIFSSKITELQHGGDGDLDRRCREAGHALEKSSRKAHANLKHRYRIEGNFLARCPCHPIISSDTGLHTGTGHSSRDHGHHRHHHHHRKSLKGRNIRFDKKINQSSTLLFHDNDSGTPDRRRRSTSEPGSRGSSLASNRKTSKPQKHEHVHHHHNSVPREDNGSQRRSKSLGAHSQAKRKSSSYHPRRGKGFPGFHKQ